MRSANLSRVALYGILIAAAILYLLPLFWWVSVAFRESASIPVKVSLLDVWIPGKVSFLENLGVAFDLYPLGRFFVNSVLVAVVVTASEVILASMAGYGLAKFAFRGRGTIFLAVISLLMIPQIVLVLPLFEMAASFDLVNSYAGLVIPFLVTPLGIFMMRQFIIDIPDDYFEAARIDGAGEWWIYVRVVLPLVRNGLVTLAVFTFLFQWDALLWPLLALSREDLYTLNVGVSLLQTNTQTPYNAIFAVALVFSVPIVAAYFILQRRVIDSISSAGVKG